MPPNSEPKNIVITGSAQGIGRCLARTLLESAAGHYVYMIDINSDELEYAATTHLKPFYDSKRVDYSAIDITNAELVRTTINGNVRQFFPGGRIDVLVNNAGIPKPVWADGKTMEEEDTLEEWNKYVAINLTAPFVLSQAVIPLMKQPQISSGLGAGSPLGGSIIHISSFRAHVSDPDSEPYGSTKSGLLGLTHSMAVSCQRWNIRVNCILPGFISVKHENRAGDEGKVPSWEERHPIDDPRHKAHLVNRLGRGEDIAHTVEFLMGAGFVTGQQFIIDGGISAKKNPTV